MKSSTRFVYLRSQKPRTASAPQQSMERLLLWDDFHWRGHHVVWLLQYLEKNLEAQSRRTEPALRRCRADKIARSIMAGKDRKTKSKNYV